MNRNWIFLFAIALWSCQNLDEVNPGNSSTFIKLIGGPNQDEAIMALPTADGGYICLATTTIEPQRAELIYSGVQFENSITQIKLIKLGQNGNTQWVKTYPSSDQYSYKGRSMLPIDDGYLIIGDSIKNVFESEGEEEDEPKSGVLVMKVNFEGTQIVEMTKIIASGPYQSFGEDAIIDSDGNLTVISKKEDETTDEDISLHTLDIQDLSLQCTRDYTGGDVDLVKSIFTTTSGDLAFGGVVKDFGAINSRVFVVPASDCSPGLISGPLLIQNNSKNYTINQLTQIPNGFAMVGTTNDTNIKTDIFMATVDQFGVQTSLKVFDLEVNGKRDEDEGLAIIATNDGGFLLGGSTRANLRDEEEVNMVLIKTDSRGNEQWVKRYGDLNEEEVVFLHQLEDNGYLVYGNTEFGGLDTIILIKTDAEGNVQ